MFVPFSIDGRPMQKRTDWTKYVQKARSRRDSLMDALRRVRGERRPNFSRRGQGPTLREWARAHKANYTLALEILTA